MSAPTPGVGYRIPSLGTRILLGGLRLVPMLVLLVGVPAALLAYLASRGISLPVSVLTVSAFGIALAALGTARYIARPTAAFGPLTVATSAVGAAYLVVLLAASPYRLTVPGTSAGFALGYAGLVLVLLAVPAFGLASGAVTTIEDLKHPGERLPFDFPA
ncbi:MAG TPA: hypothetical protein VMG99_01805 [Thermoplasmata archaeon]|nr:hypothetical protein [Thermoplasmata archaeon]